MKLHFFGGAQTVTGANYLLEAKSKDNKTVRILIDCGLNQGSYQSTMSNYEDFPYNTHHIDAVLVTHAHIDHTGRLPFLYKQGFRGRIISTHPTRDFAEQLLIDSAGLISREAEAKNKEPLYDLSDIEAIVEKWEVVNYHEKLNIGPFAIEFFDAGHILGSSFIKITGPSEDGSYKTIVFSGDLGNVSTPIVRDTEKLEEVDFVVMEALYGDRLHESTISRKDRLEDIIEETVDAGGVLMIPSFAMERTQELLYEMNELMENRRIPRVPIFIDSPLAIKLVGIYKKYADNPIYMDKEAIKLFHSGDEIFNFPGLVFTLTSEQSKSINDVPPPKIIIAGSGMSDGGRMKHHERRYLSDPRSTLLFISYQGANTLGRRIINGAQFVDIFGESIPVKCKTAFIGGYSAHGDQAKLLSWLSTARKTIKKVFLVQSDNEAAQVFAIKVRDEFALDSIIPEDNSVVSL